MLELQNEPDKFVLSSTIILSCDKTCWKSPFQLSEVVSDKNVYKLTFKKVRLIQFTVLLVLLRFLHKSAVVDVDQTAIFCQYSRSISKAWDRIASLQVAFLFSQLKHKFSDWRQTIRLRLQTGLEKLKHTYLWSNRLEIIFSLIFINF